MRGFNQPIPSASRTLRVLAHVLRYPDQTLRQHADEMISAIEEEGALGRSRTEELRWLIHRLGTAPAMVIEADYVETFDRGRQTSLLLFEHVHGDSRDRGPAMVDLTQTYEKAGLLLSPSDLPDDLPVVLEFASTQPAQQARAFLAETVHIIQAIFSALLKRQSPYASAVAAVIELAGEQAKAVEIGQEVELDESWAEPEAFGGCSTTGQAKPDQPQPIQIIRRTHTAANTNTPGAQA